MSPPRTSTPISVSPLARGDLGSYATLQRMRGLAHAAVTDPLVIETARSIVRLLPPRDMHGHAVAIRSFLAERFQFIRDPAPVELLATPRYMLEQIARRYFVQGDCDEAATLAAALGLAIGHRARFVALGFQTRTAPLAHVYAVLSGAPGEWVAMDVTRPPAAPGASRLVTMEV